MLLRGKVLTTPHTGHLELISNERSQHEAQHACLQGRAKCVFTCSNLSFSIAPIRAALDLLVVVADFAWLACGRLRIRHPRRHQYLRRRTRLSQYRHLWVESAGHRVCPLRSDPACPLNSELSSRVARGITNAAYSTSVEAARIGRTRWQLYCPPSRCSVEARSHHLLVQ